MIPPRVSRLMAILDAVAEAPPPQFSGGGQWEAMHRDMSGYYEIRSQGPKREQFRLFCILETLTRRNCGGEVYLVPRSQSSLACESHGWWSSALKITGMHAS